MAQDLIKPIDNIAYMIGCFGVIAMLVTFSPFPDGADKNLNSLVFGVAMATMHFVIALAVLRRNRSGFIAMKYYLSAFKLFIPIGTYISYKTLEYIKDKKIEDLYFK